jgi:hypothetical protein
MRARKTKNREDRRRKKKERVRMWNELTHILLASILCLIQRDLVEHR